MAARAKVVQLVGPSSHPGKQLRSQASRPSHWPTPGPQSHTIALAIVAQPCLEVANVNMCTGNVRSYKAHIRFHSSPSSDSQNCKNHITCKHTRLEIPAECRRQLSCAREHLQHTNVLMIMGGLHSFAAEGTNIPKPYLYV